MPRPAASPSRLGVVSGLRFAVVVVQGLGVLG